MSMKTLLFVAALVLVVLSQTPPEWPVRFQTDFIQTYAVTSTRVVGRMWYDSERGMSRFDRNNGRYNDFCGTILNATAPCQHLVRDGKRYIIFPSIRSCCLCCDAAHGCGIMRRDWLKEAKYAGKDELDGQIFNKWVLGDRSWWASQNTAQTPRKLAEFDLFYKDFILNSYTEAPIDISAFNLPSFCTGTPCSATSQCGRFQ